MDTLLAWSPFLRDLAQDPVRFALWCVLCAALGVAVSRMLRKRRDQRIGRR